MASAATASGPRPGRPSTGARERILAAALEVLKADGYAGLTVAKVAARAGSNTALIAYHFGSKQGLVAAAGREVGETITADVLDGLEGAAGVADVIDGAMAGIWRVLERDARLARVYFDLNAVSIVDDDVRGVMREVKANWRAVLGRLLRDAGLPPSRCGPGAVMVMAGLEGLSLEWIERGDTPELRRAKRMFAAAAARELAESIG